MIRFTIASSRGSTPSSAGPISSIPARTPPGNRGQVVGPHRTALANPRRARIGVDQHDGGIDLPDNSPARHRVASARDGDVGLVHGNPGDLHLLAPVMRRHASLKRDSRKRAGKMAAGAERYAPHARTHSTTATGAPSTSSLGVRPSPGAGEALSTAPSRRGQPSAVETST